MLPPFVTNLEKRDPQFYNGVMQIIEISTQPGALDTKTKLLISLALDAIMGARNGVKSLSMQLRKIGASEEEIAEALRLSYHVAGMNVLSTMDWVYNE